MKVSKIFTEKDEKDVLRLWGVLFGMSLTSKGVAGGIVMKAASDLEFIIRKNELMTTKDFNKIKKRTARLLLDNPPKLKEFVKKGEILVGEFAKFYDE